MYEYQGPADTFQLEDGGKVYRIGDNVPISKELAVYLTDTLNGGHRFKGVNPLADVEPVATMAPEEALPFDERGQQVDPKAKK